MRGIHAEPSTLEVQCIADTTMQSISDGKCECVVWRQLRQVCEGVKLILACLGAAAVRSLYKPRGSTNTCQVDDASNGPEQSCTKQICPEGKICHRMQLAYAGACFNY